ncbi:MAG: NUDIX domain-containing protein [Treponema sp.]
MSRSVACIVYEDGKVLIAKRIENGDMGGRWEFPGGKIDGNEDASAAITREMSEEFGVKARAEEKICSASFIHRGKECFVTAYRVRLERDGVQIPFTLSEHTEYEWVNADEIPNRPFVDSDLKLYPAVKEYLEKQK